MANAHKDLGYYTAMAADSGAARAIAEGVQGTYAQAVQHRGRQALVSEQAAQLAQAGDGTASHERYSFNS